MIIINYLIVCLIFGTTFLMIRVGIDAGLPPFFSGGARFFIAGLAVILLYLIRRMPFPSLSEVKKLIVVGFYLTFGTFSTLYWAEQYVPSGLAAFLSAFAPIFVFLLTNAKSSNVLAKTQIAGLVFGLIGVLFIAFPGLKGDINILWIMGSLAIIIGQIFYSLGAIRSKEIMSSQTRVSPFLLNGIQMCSGGLMLLLLSFIVEKPSAAILGLSNITALLSLLYLIIFGSIIGHGLFYWLVGKTNPLFPSTWQYISPFIALVAGYLFLNETVEMISILGAFIVIIGVFLVNQKILLEHYRKGSLIKRHT